MSQNVVDFSQNPTGPELMDNFLAKVQENLKTCNSGISRPSYAAKGTFWLDTSVTPHLLKQYDGSDDVVLGSVDITNHVFTPNSPLLTNGGNDKYVLTANGVGNAPTYQKNPIGVYEYSSSRTYGLNDFVMQYDSTDEKVKLYRSTVADNLNNPLSDTTKWEEVSLGGDSALPSQTGHSGDLLTTDGTDASWVDTETIYPVVETYVNGTSWYRVYSDGWVEQGGEYTTAIATNGNVQITLLKPFTDTNYNVQVTGRFESRTDGSSAIAMGAYAESATLFSIVNDGAVSNNKGAFWQACGYGA